MSTRLGRSTLGRYLEVSNLAKSHEQRGDRPHSFSSSDSVCLQHSMYNSNSIWHYRSSPRKSVPAPMMSPHFQHRRAASSVSSPTFQVAIRPQTKSLVQRRNRLICFTVMKLIKRSKHSRAGSTSSAVTTTTVMPQSPTLWSLKQSNINISSDLSPREFLTKLETWFIEQVLSSFSPLLESVTQHYNDSETIDRDVEKHIH